MIAYFGKNLGPKAINRGKKGILTVLPAHAIVRALITLKTVMKVDIHPTTHPVVFVDTSCGAEFVTTSTLTSNETRAIDGVDHYVINIEISSASHPFYTGKQILIDTARRVEKFEARMKKQADAAATRKGKKAKKAKKAAEALDAEKAKAPKAEKKEAPKAEAAPVEAPETPKATTEEAK